MQWLYSFRLVLFFTHGCRRRQYIDRIDTIEYIVNQENWSIVIHRSLYNVPGYNSVNDILSERLNYRNGFGNLLSL